MIAFRLPIHLPIRILAVGVLMAWTIATASAHCDGVDGPVVAAARAALAAGRVEQALAWVQAKDEAEIRAAFVQTLAVRSLSPEAQELADRFFFETLVRVHRAGEGAGFDGLKPAGRDLGPAIPAADRAVASGTIKEVQALLAKDIETGLHARFHAVLETKAANPTDVAAGRLHVAAYVDFVHYVVGLHGAASGAGGHHDEDEGAAPKTEKAVHHHE